MSEREVGVEVNPVTPECGGAVPGDDCEGSITIWHENFRSTQWLCVKHYKEARERKRANALLREVGGDE
jgi:hypothetical protein